jgi:hypothetical protein
MFRYLSVGHGSAPPVSDDFTHVVDAETCAVGLRSGDTRGAVTSRVLRREDEPDVGISDQCFPHVGHAGFIRVFGPVVLIQYCDLALDLVVRDVFGGIVVDNVDDDRDGDRRFWCEGFRPEGHPLRSPSLQLSLPLAVLGLRLDSQVVGGCRAAFTP